MTKFWSVRVGINGVGTRSCQGLGRLLQLHSHQTTPITIIVVYIAPSSTHEIISPCLTTARKTTTLLSRVSEIGSGLSSAHRAQSPPLLILMRAAPRPLWTIPWVAQSLALGPLTSTFSRLFGIVSYHRSVLSFPTRALLFPIQVLTRAAPRPGWTRSWVYPRPS